VALLERPSIYDEAVILMAKRGFAVDKSCVARDWSAAREPNETVIAAWRRVYQDTETHWDLYELAESLMDIDDLFQTWRFRHANTVERIIGSKPGTGGTSGAAYLRKAVGIRLFEELWAVRTGL
jgi:tryptophan 2,3-dioxygenase